MAKPNNWRELSSFQTLVHEINEKWGSSYANPETDINVEIRKVFESVEDDDESYEVETFDGTLEDHINSMFDEVAEAIGCPPKK